MAGVGETHFFVKKQRDSMKNMALGPTLEVPGRPVDPLAAATTALFPRTASPGPEGSAIWQRATRFCTPTRAGMPVLVPTELVTARLIDLPAGTGRRRDALLAYALEDFVAQPIESLTVVRAPLQGAPRDQVLALVIATSDLAALKPGLKLPDMLLIRRPAAPAAGLAWAVWRDGARALVRVSDGTGFAVGIDMLPLLWARAGKPVLTSVGAALPAGLPATDLSHAPPDPDPADLAFRLAPLLPAGDPTVVRGPLIAIAASLMLGLAAHLGLAVADNRALERIAATEQARVQTLLDTVLPGTTLTADPGPILAQLAPRAEMATQGPFLPLLAQVMTTLADGATAVSLRRLGWTSDGGKLTLTLQAAGLAELQTFEQRLKDSGLVVTSGAANAADGRAEVDLVVSGGGQ